MSGEWTDTLSREQLIAAVRETEDALARQTATTLRLDGTLERVAAMIGLLIAEVRRPAGLRAGTARRKARTDTLAVQAWLLHEQGLSLARIAERQDCDRSTARRRLRRAEKL